MRFKGSKNFFVVFLGLSLLASPGHTIDPEIVALINSCDILYCAGATNNATNNWGVQVQAQSAPRVSIPQIPTPRIRPGAPPLPTTPLNTVTNQGLDHPGAADTGVDSNNQRMAAAANASGASPLHGGSQSSSMGLTGQSGQAQPTNSQVRNGFLYRDEEPKGGSAPNSTGQGAFQHSPGSWASQAALGNGNGLSAGTGPQAGALVNGAQAGLPTGVSGTESGGSRVDPSNTGGESLLGRIANSLGLNSFFSASGKTSGQAGAIKNVNPTAPGRGPGQANGPLQDPRQILQAQFDRFGKSRGLASQLEFASRDSSLFGRMCGHYQTYARHNRIPTAKQNCSP